MFTKELPKYNVIHIRETIEELADSIPAGASVWEVTLREIPNVGRGTPFWKVSYLTHCCEENEWEFHLLYDDGSGVEDVSADEWEVGYHYGSSFTATGLRGGLAESLKVAVQLWADACDSDLKGSWRFYDAPKPDGPEYRDGVRAVDKYMAENP